MACKTSCSFFAYAGSRLFDANDRPELGAEYQYLVLMDDISGSRRTVIAYSYSAGNVFLRSVWNKKWQTDDWFPLATRKSPEVHNFPLANGFTGDLIYYKTQENICTVSGCIYGTFTKDSYISIGYLPEGFHSAHALELPVTASYGVGVRCSVATDGNVVVIMSTSGVAYVYLNISFPCA